MIPFQRGENYRMEGNLLGFYLEYADAGGMGSIDVMATRIESEEDEESWAVGFVIHEAASAE